MPNDCLVTKLKGTVNNSGLLLLGEAKIIALANKAITILWNNFNADTDIVRIISGGGTVESTSGGWIVTAGADGCVIGASEKYRINQINSTGNEIGYIISADDFAYRSTPFKTLSRAKIIGNITPMFVNNTIRWFEWFDLSEASGVFPVVTNIDTIRPVANTPAPNVQLSFSGALTAPKTLQGSFKSVDMPISYIAGRTTLMYFFDKIGDASVKLVGDIANLGVLSAVERFNVNGSQLVGDFGSYIVSYASKTSGSIRFLNASQSGMTVHGIAMANNDDFAGLGILVGFSASEITLKYKGDSVIFGTYNKATQSWTWNV